MDEISLMRHVDVNILARNISQCLEMDQRDCVLIESINFLPVTPSNATDAYEVLRALLDER